MKLFSLALMGVSSFGVAAYGAVDASLLNLMMPDAKALAGASVEQSRNSAFGQYLVAQLDNRSLEELTSATGIDPRKDIREILAATTGQGASLVAVKGNFPTAKLEAAASANGMAPETYKGIPLVNTKPDAKGEFGSIALIDSSTLLAGTSSAVRAAIDRKAEGKNFSGPLAQRSREVSATNDAWFASSTSFAQFATGRVPQQLGNGIGNVLQAITQGSGGVKFAATGVTLNLEAVARSPQDAQALTDVLRFVASMVQTQRSQGAAQSKAAAVLDNTTFAATGSVAHVTMTVPEQQLEMLVMPARRGGAQPRVN